MRTDIFKIKIHLKLKYGDKSVTSVLLVNSECGSICVCTYLGQINWEALYMKWFPFSVLKFSNSFCSPFI